MPSKIPDAVRRRAMGVAREHQVWSAERHGELNARRIECECRRAEMDDLMADVAKRITDATRVGGGRSVPKELKNEWDALVVEFRKLTDEVAGIDQTLRFHLRVRH